MDWEQQVKKALISSVPKITGGDRTEFFVAQFFVRRRAAARREFLWWSFGLLLSTTVLIYFLNDTVYAVHTSGLSQLISLLWSDAREVVTDWHEFIFSVLELIPVISFTGILLALCGVLITTVYLIHTWAAARVPKILFA